MPESKAKEPDTSSDDRTNTLRWILPVLFILLLITLAYAIYPMFTATDGPQIVLNAVRLRTEQQTLARSNLITNTDELVRTTGNRVLLGQWNLLTQCFAQGCSDEEYFNFIALVAQHMTIPNSDLVQNMIITYRTWGTNEIVRFSKAMTTVTRGIDDTFSRSLEEKWKQVIECDGSCAEKNDLYFQAIEIAVSL